MLGSKINITLPHARIGIKCVRLKSLSTLAFDGAVVHFTLYYLKFVGWAVAEKVIRVRRDTNIRVEALDPHNSYGSENRMTVVCFEIGST